MAPPGTLEELDAALTGAALLGLELDTRYRVLAATLEPAADRDPWSAPTDRPDGAEPDRRVQLLVSPVSTLLASLRRRVPGTAGPRLEVYTFGEDQLVDVVAALGEAPVAPPLFDRAEPRPGQWAPQWSLEGRSTAADGTRHTLTLSVEHDDGAGTLALDVFARFDELKLRDASGRERLSLGGPGEVGLDLGTG